MPDAVRPRRRSSARVTIWLFAVLICCVLGTGVWLTRRIARDRATAATLAGAMSAPRVIFDGRSLEARFDLAVEDLAAAQGTTAPAILAALERFASGGWPGTRRTGYDAFLTQLAARRFEIAIATLRDFAISEKTKPTSEVPAWRLLTLAAVLEFGRGRAASADPLLQSAFDLANRATQLDIPEAASLLTALGASQLSRSQPAAAEPYLRRASSLLARTPGADLRDRARVLTHFAQAIAAQGFPEEAEPLCSEALALAAQYRRATGRPDTDHAIIEENYRKLLRLRGLADTEIDAQLRATLEPR